MTDKRFKVVFSGELQTGSDPAEVKRKLAQLFRMDQTAVERLFSGRPVVVKKEADYAAAKKYLAAFKQAGALCKMVEIGTEEIEIPPPPAAPSPASTVEPEPAEQRQPVESEPEESEEPSQVISVQGLFGIQGLGGRDAQAAETHQGGVSSEQSSPITEEPPDTSPASEPASEASPPEIPSRPAPPVPEPPPSVSEEVKAAPVKSAETGRSYRIVFKGELKDGQDITVVKKNLAAMFKAEPVDIETLFEGGSVVIEDNVSDETAEKHAAAMARTGAHFRVEPVPSSGPAVGEAPAEGVQEAMIVKERALWELKKLEEKFELVKKLRQAFLSAVGDHKQIMKNMITFNPMRNIRADKIRAQQAAFRVQQTMEAYNQAAQDVVITEKIALGVPLGTLRGTAGLLDPTIKEKDESYFDRLKTKDDVELLNISDPRLKEILLTIVKVREAEDKIEQIRINASNDFGALSGKGGGKS